MSIGKIGEFNVASDNWRLYVDRLEQYFIVNKIPSELQVPTLVTVIGAECYELLVNLCTPSKPTDKNFVELTNILETHLQPKPSILAERYKFRHRQQKDGESMLNYVAVLRKMSKTCEFKEWLEDSLRDQFVCGVQSETIRQRLFAEGDIDFAKAFKLAVSMEAAEKDAATVEGRPGSSSDGKDVVQCQVIAGSVPRRQSAAAAAPPGRDANSGYEYKREARGARGSNRGGRAALRLAPTSAATRRQEVQCGACGGRHDTATCRFVSYFCKVCNKQGHLKRVCPYLTNNFSTEVVLPGAPMPRYSYYTEQHSDDSEEVIVINFNQLAITACKPIMIRMNVQGVELDMECDTGSAVSCISQELYKQLFTQLEIKNCNLKLRYYTGELVSPVGIVRPLVKYGGKEKFLDLYVIKNGKTVLIGRQWLIELGVKVPIPLKYQNVNSISEQEFNLTAFSSRFCEVFADGLGRFTGGQVSIHLRPDARPVFLRARPLAYALREPVERALDQLVRDGVLTPVDRSDWATPIVPVVKKDGTVRICADYKLTLNKMLEVDRYPLPRVDDLLTRLYGGQRFSKIDLSQAYAQFELDESRKYTVINTHKGLFRYNRLVYGLASSPGIFQRRLEQMFADLPHVGVFLDDVIITGSDTTMHINNLVKVFERLQTYGLRVKKEKCVFFAKSINYLGHVISKNGIHTCPEKVMAIVNTPAPSNISELRAFIGMVMYYAKFIKNVSNILAPMYNLLKAGSRFVWCQECESAFKVIKQALSSSEVLTHYSESLPLIMTADASGVGLGAVISHVTAQGERPIAYASRTLTAAERAYAQIDKEALAIVFGIRKFHQYLYGRKFVLRTDHKPLTHIFGNKVGIPVMAASRIQRWAVLLSGYDYQIEYVASAKNCADALSRLPQNKSTESVKDDITYLNFVENFLPVSNNDVRAATAKDALLGRVVTYVQSGWPTSCPDDGVRAYFTRRHELYIDRGCLMWGYRMVVPTTLRTAILKQLHVGHMGIVKTKSLARSYVWWPNIDADVEATCKSCETCALEAPAPAQASPSPWPYNTRPWTRLHVDFLGPYKGKTFLILIDSSSKWLEIFEMSRTNAGTVIKELRATFARFGLPIELVSDQGPPFTSVEFKDFLSNNGIRQLFSPAYHPASNGAAENAVNLCKRALKKAHRDGIDIDSALQAYLLAYRNSVHSSTGESPAMLLQRRPLRSRLDLLRSDRALEDRVHEAQRRQARPGAQRQLELGEEVWARNYTGPDKWVRRTIVDKLGSRRYTLDNGDGRPSVRHVDQIRRISRMSSVPCRGVEHVEPNEGPGSSETEALDMGKEEADKFEREEAKDEQIRDAAAESAATPPCPRPTPPRARSPVMLRPLGGRIRKYNLNID